MARPRRIKQYLNLFIFSFLCFPLHVCRYKRFKLSDDKDFSSLFFPEKDDMLKLLEHFENKTGEEPFHARVAAESFWAPNMRS